MHPGSFEFVSRFATGDALTVVEIGSRDINGTVRPLFPAAVWIGLDLYAGPSVDVVCDALDYNPENPVDIVLIAEVFEHCRYWGEVLHHVAGWIKPGGRILITCAGPGRDPHSHHDGGELRDGEHYENVTQDQLAEELSHAGFRDIEVSGNEYWRDTYATAIL